MNKKQFELAQAILRKINNMESTISKLETLLDKGISGVTVYGIMGGCRHKVEVELQPDDAIKDLVKEALAENRVELDKLYKEFEEA